MFVKKIALVFSIILLNNCTGFKSVYKENLEEIYNLQSFTIVSDKKKASQKVKKNLINIFPTRKKIKYIIKIQTQTDTSGTVSDITRKISRYKTEVSAKVNIYQRKKEYDKLIYSFEEKRSAPYTLVLNNIRSTLASKDKAEETCIRLLSEEIYKRILIYLASN